MNKDIDPAEVREMLDYYSADGEPNRDTIIADSTKIGYWLAVANGKYHAAKDERETAEANIILSAKLADPKMSAALLQATATKSVEGLKKAETKARTNAEKLQNLWTVLTSLS